jgi:hypothetical protein
MLCDGLGLFKKFFTQLSSPLMLQLFLVILSLGESHAIRNWHFSIICDLGPDIKVSHFSCRLLCLEARECETAQTKENLRAGLLLGPSATFILSCTCAMDEQSGGCLLAALRRYDL